MVRTRRENEEIVSDFSGGLAAGDRSLRSDGYDHDRHGRSCRNEAKRCWPRDGTPNTFVLGVARWLNTLGGRLRKPRQGPRRWSENANHPAAVLFSYSEGGQAVVDDTVR
jgi:hypothetical protein